jgi:hypothetical protein
MSCALSLEARFALPAPSAICVSGPKTRFHLFRRHIEIAVFRCFAID